MPKRDQALEWLANEASEEEVNTIFERFGNDIDASHVSGIKTGRRWPL